MSEWSGVHGKRVLITGATNGIGLAAAEELARRGGLLSIVARSDAKAADAVERIRAAGAEQVDVLKADLSSQRAISALAAEVLERYPRLDVLVNNAGAINEQRQVTADGLELTWAVNHLAPLLLTELLLDRLKASAPARIVTTTSDAHKGAHIPFDDLNAERSYGQRLSPLRRDEAREHPLHRRAGTQARRHRRDSELLPPGPRRDRLQPQQQRADEDRDDGGQAVLAQPGEGCGDARLAGRLARGRRRERRLLRRLQA